MGRAGRPKSGPIGALREEAVEDLDPLLRSLVPAASDEEAELWLRGDRSLIQAPEEVCPGMTEAAQDLLRTLREGEQIALFSDYDVDGVTGGEILRGVFLRLGKEPLMEYASPKDGFGLTREFVQRAWDDGCRTLVTVDCGSQSHDAIELASELGMKVVVTDHHSTNGENGATYHLNPQLYDPRPSMATGSQMAWHLGAAILQEAEGSVPEDYYERPLYLAGLGCVADWGPHRLTENRPFLKASDAPPGVQALAESKGEDARTFNLLWKTSAALNLAKRTNAVHGSDAARVLRAETAEEAAEAIEFLNQAGLESWKRQKSVEDAMKESDLGDGRLAFYVTEAEDISGVAGTLALKAAKQSGRPSFVFAPMKEVDGETVYKFSGRIPSGQAQRIIEMSEDPEIKGIVLTGGGHDKVFSGECRQQDIPRLQAAMLRWADAQPSWQDPDQKTEKPYHGQIEGKRLPALVNGAQKLGPFHQVDEHFGPRVSVRGEIRDVRSEGYQKFATLQCEDGSSHEVQVFCSEGAGEVFIQVRAGEIPLAEKIE